MTGRDVIDPVDAAVRVERLDDVEGGQYWTVREGCGGEDDSGPYGDGLVEGRTYLVEEARLLDHAVHTVVVAFHPLEGRGARRLLAAQFYARFERTENPDAVRAAEMAAVQRTIAEASDEMAGGAPAALLEGAAREAAKADGPASGTAVATSADAEMARRTREQARRVAVHKASAQWLEERAARIGELAETVAAFGREKALAARAGLQSALERAAYLEQGVKTLGLYTGDGVEVEILRDGEPAPDDAPLTLFQRRLYMDEEWLYNVAAGGADWKDLDGFKAALQEDPALLERILPAERAVVSMAYRRSGRDYLGDAEFPSAAAHFFAVLDSAQQNVRNQSAFLLVRDGGKVWQVSSELSAARTPRLFPTRSEVDKPFRGWDGERITRDSVRFTDSMEEAEAIQLHYRRLLVLLWGLDDRLGLVGLRRTGDSRNYTDLAFQERFRFVCDDEDDFLLATGRPRFSAWAKEMNAHLRSGSRVLCLWKPLINPDDAPACAKRRPGRDSFDVSYSPRGAHAVCVARRDGEDYVVDVEVSGKTSYRGRDGRGRDGQRDRSFVARVRLPETGGPVKYLVLDAVRLADLDYYLSARAERRHYLAYAEAFFRARDAVRADEEAQAGARADMVRAIVDGRLAEPAGPRAGEAVDEGVRAWRATHRGAPFPVPGAPAWGAARDAVMDHCWTVLHGPSEMAEAAGAVAASLGREPLRLTLTGKARLALYAGPAAGELDRRVDRWPFAMRVPLDRERGSLRPRAGAWAPLRARDASERVLRDWPEAAALLDAEDCDRLGHRNWTRLLEWLDSGDRLAAAALRAGRAAALRMLEDARTLSEEESHGNVFRPEIRVPLLLAREIDGWREAGPGAGLAADEPLRVGWLAVDAVAWAWAAGARREAEEWIEGRYENPKTALAALRKGPGRPALKLGLARYAVDSLAPGGHALLGRGRIAGHVVEAPRPPASAVAALLREEDWQGNRKTRRVRWRATWTRPSADADVAAACALLAGKKGG
jgi:hypothetical protein